MNDDLPHTDVQDGYDRWATTYDEYDNPLTLIEEPVVRKLVGDPSGLAIADIGCGTGRHAVPLAGAGALVTGVDFSGGMLGVLREKCPPGSLELVEHDLAARIPLPDDRFDVALCCLVLEHVEDLDSALAELARICRPGGAVIVSDLHPEMTRRGLHARFKDRSDGRKYQLQGSEHTVADYVMAGVRNGLQLEHVAEHIVDEAATAHSQSARKYVGLPFLLTLRWIA